MFGNELKRIRKSLGYPSARSFYREFLGRRAVLGFNYSYYMKVEGGRALPSPAMVTELAALLPSPEHQAELVTAYCRSLFPRYEGLFDRKSRAPSSPAFPPDAGEGALLVKPRFLTAAQVSCLARSRCVYYLFLILTLARGPVRITDLSRAIGEKDVSSALAELAAARLALVEGGFASSSAKEMKFPPGESASVKKQYAVIDQWNLEFGQRMDFEQLANRMQVRRISPRYSSLILSHLELLAELLKAADEVQQDLNDEVVMLNILLFRGNLPG